MTSMLRRAMLYLGLGPDDEYDDYDAHEDPRPAPRQQPQAASRYPASAPAPVREPEPEHDSPGPSSSVRTIGGQSGSVRPQPSGSGGDPSARPRTAVVRPLQ